MERHDDARRIQCHSIPHVFLCMAQPTGMCLKLASYSYSISASITDFAQNVFTGQIDHAEFESVVRFDFEGDLQGQIQGQRTGNAL